MLTLLRPSDWLTDARIPTTSMGHFVPNSFNRMATQLFPLWVTPDLMCCNTCVDVHVKIKCTINQVDKFMWILVHHWGDEYCNTCSNYWVKCEAYNTVSCKKCYRQFTCTCLIVRYCQGLHMHNIIKKPTTCFSCCSAHSVNVLNIRWRALGYVFCFAGWLNMAGKRGGTLDSRKRNRSSIVVSSLSISSSCMASSSWYTSMSWQT